MSAVQTPGFGFFAALKRLEEDVMLQIGCHLSSVKGFEHMGEEALSIGANTFQFFTRNPRGGKAKDIDPEDVKRFLELADEHHFAKLVAHAPYTLNPCSATEKVRDFALFAMEDDMKRMEYVPGNYYNFHPGSHVGQGTETGVEAEHDHFAGNHVGKRQRSGRQV